LDLTRPLPRATKWKKPDDWQLWFLAKGAWEFLGSMDDTPGEQEIGGAQFRTRLMISKNVNPLAQNAKKAGNLDTSAFC